MTLLELEFCPHAIQAARLTLDNGSHFVSDHGGTLPTGIDRWSKYNRLGTTAQQTATSIQRWLAIDAG